MRPDRVGYLPGPLAYRCDTCEKACEFVSPSHQVADPLSMRCTGEHRTKDCRWRQLDVVFVHWSGGLEGLSPFRFTVNNDGEVQKIPRCQCGVNEFRLIKQGNQFSRWRFRCSGCGAEREVYQTDPFSLSCLKPRMDQGVPHQWNEINMIPISYRASPVFYVQSARFIVYDADPEVVTLMQPSKHADLVSKIATLHGYGGSDPSEERIREQLQANGQAAQWPAYKKFSQQAQASRNSGDEAFADTFDSAARTLLQSWYDSGFVVPEAVATPALQEQIHARSDFARRFDPIRSTVEHNALRRRKIEATSESHDLRQVHPDLCAEHGVPELEHVYRARVAEDLAHAGIQDAYLIRNLDMVEFSFGFTRVSATPITVQKDRPMPVRLMGFPPLPNHKRPVYVIEQQNEAIYIRLQSEAVAEYLMRNGVLSTPPSPPLSLGSALIEQYEDFGPFLQPFGVRDPGLTRTLARRAIYDLLAAAHDGPPRHARYRPFFRTRSQFHERSDIPGGLGIACASSRHDRGPRKHLIHVARP